MYNGHGGVVQMVDENGNIVNRYSYDEWRNILEKQETIENPK
ncbi:RHS repeat protein [Geosporobacter ferrireducens]|nr:RHS repeat protein [Geosporobacter ferrireducens]